MITDLPNILTLSRVAAIPVLIVLASLRLPGGLIARAEVGKAKAKAFNAKGAEERRKGRKGAVRAAVGRAQAGRVRA